MYGIDNLHCRLLQRFQSLIRGDHDGLRETGDQVAAAHFHGQHLGAAVSRADLNLDILTGSLTDQKVVFLSHVTDHCLVEVIARDLNRSRDDGAAEGDDSDVRGAAADVDDHISAGLRNVDARTDCRGNRLLNDCDFLCACLVGRILHGLSLDLGRAGGNADRNAGTEQGLLADRLVDEVLEHLLGHGVIRDDTVAERTNRNDIARRTADHETRLLTDCENAVGVAVNRDDARLL